MAKRAQPLREFFEAGPEPTRARPAARSGLRASSAGTRPRKPTTMGTTVAAASFMIGRPAAVFVLGLLFLASGAAMALPFLVNLESPLAQSTVSILFLIWGSQLVEVSWTARARRALSCV